VIASLYISTLIIIKKKKKKNPSYSYCWASRSYCIVWSSRATFWLSLFQTWIFWRFACLQYAVAINVFTRWNQHLRLKS